MQRRKFIQSLTAALIPGAALAQTPSLLPSASEYQILIHAKDNEMLVGIRADGTMEFGPHYTPEGAAKIFWDTVDRMNPGRCRSL